MAHFQRPPLWLALSLISSPAAAQCERQSLKGPQWFGEALAVEGERAVVGRGVFGMAHVYERTPEGWQFVQELDGPHRGFVADSEAVAIHGDIAVTSAPYTNESYWTEIGQAIIHEWDGVAWTRIAWFMGWTDREHFGHDVGATRDSLGRDLVAFGSKDAPLTMPYVDVFARQGTGSWSITDHLTLNDWLSAPGIGFGEVLAISGDLLAIGAPVDRDSGAMRNAGRVYMAERAGTSFAGTQHFTASDAGPDWGFGSALDLDGSRLVVGLGADAPVRQAYVLEFDGFGWVERAILRPSDPTARTFGKSVAVLGDRILVGAPDADGAMDGSGAAYLFEKSGNEWIETAKLTASGGLLASLFGGSVALSADGDLLASDRFRTRVHVFDSGPDGANHVYCEAAPNSAGTGCELTYQGTLSIARNDFRLRGMGGVPNQPGLFYYGLVPVQFLFGHGFRCIGGEVFRLYPLVAPDAAGDVRYHVDFDAPPAVSGAGLISPGSTWKFQYWYRDPFAGAPAFNLSNALSATFCP